MKQYLEIHHCQNSLEMTCRLIKSSYNGSMEKKFGDWTFICELKNKHGKTDFECRCKCGLVKLVDRKNLLTGRSKRCSTCSYRDRSFIDQMIGKNFGDYFVIDKQITKNKDTHYKCKCSCGAIRIVRGTDLRSGASNRCHDCGLKKKIVHELCNTPTYKTWKGIRQRCCNKNSKAYRYYGQRGIKMCERWCENFINFYNDMGVKPEGLELDRIDPDGNYEPSNCR
jgi:predicted SprT family Zn-dependent metalloprotease